jgi:hypothetical protein
MMRLVWWCALLIAMVAATGDARADVEYLHEDLDTQGSWRGVYGSSGGVIFDAGGVNGANVPGQDNDQLVDGLLAEYVDGSPNRWNWASAVADDRGLEFADEGVEDRIGACQYGNGSGELSFTVDATEYEIAVYFVDWDSSARLMEVSGHQGNAPADPDAVVENPDFHEGVWHVWSVTGDDPFELSITQSGGANWVLSGVFVDAPQAVSSTGKASTTWGVLKQR